MHKIKINGYFKNDDLNTVIKYDCYGEKNGDNITFKHEDDIISISDNKDKVCFKRENNEIIMNYEFSTKEITTNNTYKLKEENLEVNFEIKTIRILNIDGKMYIEFEMNDNYYQLNIDYEVL